MDKKLLDYIQQSKKQGFSDERIKKALLDAGWKEEDINQGMKNVGSLASNIEPDSSASKPFFLTKKLPSWMFLLFAIGSAIIVVLIAWQSIVILSDIHQTSLDIAESSKNIQRENQFAGWKTYRNEELGIEFKYPNNWNLSSWNITNPSNPGYKVLIKNEGNNKESVTISITANYPSLPDFDTNAPLSQKLIGGLKAQEQIFPNGWCDVLSCTNPFIGLWVKNKEYIYTFEFNNTTTITGIYNQILSTFKFIDKPNVCTDPPALGIGVHYPIDSRYEHLPHLGELFTADDCGLERLNEIYGGKEADDKMGSVIFLKINPTPSLINALKQIGFECADSNNEESCKKWQLEKTVKIKDLLKLKSYFDEFERDDCIFCG